MSANTYCQKPGCKPGTPSNPQVILKDYFFSPIVVNLSQINNVDCGCCVTKYEIISTDNFEVDYASSSLGEVRGHTLNSFLPWTFNYQVSCLACPDGQQFTFGPKTVSGDPTL
jgi:hypothetical protein